ncbi:zinc finger protein ZFP2-like [Uranotaenia lowii]|uniref:zinc finger protein ZFP2-like n=1 Tax=Uranotaenia lowii TaxID=190385 RepID=UPI00247A779A|nr:zinc finger protein ZFP2-like [Uranotaenia lowii]
MENLCRICVTNGNGELLPMHHSVEDKTVEYLIRFCSGLKIEKSNPYPKKCCAGCVDNLQLAYSTIVQCQESEGKLQLLLENKNHGAEEEYSLQLTADEESDVSYSGLESESDFVQDENLTVIIEEGPDESTTCCACRKNFRTVEALTKHITSIHEPERSHDSTRKPFQCEVCFKRYFKKTSLNRHKRLGRLGMDILIPTKEPEAPIDHRCCGCRKDFESSEQLKAHALAEHSNVRVPHDEAKPFECEICFKRYTNKTSLSRHFRERFVDKRIQAKRQLKDHQCCGCREEFENEHELDQHSKEIHFLDRMKDSESLKPFECLVCYSRFSTQTALDRHKSTISMPHLYRCEQCDKFFVKLIMFRMHERKYHNGVQQEVIGPYQCAHCGKTFMQQSSLTHHEKLHDDLPERFECTICSKTFSNKGNLQTHVNKQHINPTAEKVPAFECPICRCSFKTPNYLEIHSRVHTGEKPFQCEFCSKQFAHSSGYKRHLLTHSAIKPYACRICGREFSNQPNLAIHEKGHGTERDARCDICGKEFVHNRYLRKHRKRHFK